MEPPLPSPPPSPLPSPSPESGGGGSATPVVEDPAEAAMPNFIEGVPDWCAPTSGVADSSLKLGIFTPLPWPGPPTASW